MSVHRDKIKSNTRVNSDSQCSQSYDLGIDAVQEPVGVRLDA